METNRPNYGAESSDRRRNDGEKTNKVKAAPITLRKSEI